MRKISLILVILSILLMISNAGCRPNPSTPSSDSPSETTTKIFPTLTNTWRWISPPFIPTETPSPILNMPPLATWAGPVPQGAYARFFKGVINDIDVSNDGKQLAVAGPVGLFVYAMDTFNPILQLATSEALGSAAFSPDEKMIATGTFSSGKIYLWDSASGKLLRKFSLDSNDKAEVAFSPNGKMLASIADDEILLWNITRDQTAIRLSGELGCLMNVAFSPDGTIIACSNHKDEIYLWDVAGGNILRTLKGHTEIIWDIAFSPNGKTLASTSSDMTVIIWDVQSGNRLCALDVRSTFGDVIAWSPNGKEIATSSPEDTITLWNSASCMRSRTFTKKNIGFLNHVIFLADDDTLLVRSTDDTVSVWNLASGEIERSLEDHNSWVTTIAFSPDGHTLAVEASAGIYLWDVPSKGGVPPIREPQWIIEDSEDFAFSPDGKILAYRSDLETGRIILVDPISRERIRTWETPGSMARLVFSPGGEIIASSSPDGAIALWDATHGRLIRTLGQSLRMMDYAFNKDGSRLAIATVDGGVMVWDVSSGESIAVLDDDNSVVRRLVFSPVSEDLYFVIGVKVMKWDGIIGSTPEIINIFPDTVVTMDISPDGNTLAVGLNLTFADRSDVLISNLADPDKTPTLLGFHIWPVCDIAFFPDGKTIASSSDDGTVVLWEYKE